VIAQWWKVFCSVYAVSIKVDSPLVLMYYFKAVLLALVAYSHQFSIDAVMIMGSINIFYFAAMKGTFNQF
jgi:hypothetical protein